MQALLSWLTETGWHPQRMYFAQVKVVHQVNWGAADWKLKRNTMGCAKCSGRLCIRDTTHVQQTMGNRCMAGTSQGATTLLYLPEGCDGKSATTTQCYVVPVITWTILCRSKFVPHTYHGVAKHIAAMPLDPGTGLEGHFSLSWWCKQPLTTI